MNDQLEPRLGYDVPRQPWPNGVDPGNLTLHPKWLRFSPSEIEIASLDHNEGYSKLPRKALAGWAVCFFKPLDYDEMDTYKGIEVLGLSDKARVPRLISVVVDEQSSHIIGLLLNRGNRTWEFPETPSTLRMKWDTEVTTTLACLQNAHIIQRGDVKATNVLVGINGDAWIIDFDSGYTPGWMGKDHMETIQGDQEGLFNIHSF